MKKMGVIGVTSGNAIAGLNVAMGSIDEVFVLRGLERSQRVSDVPSVEWGERLFFRGWAAHPTQPVACARVAMFVDGVQCGIVRSRRRRPDVAQHLENPDLLRVGFLACLDVKNVRPGRHEVRFVLDGGQSALSAVAIEVIATAAAATPEPSFDFQIDEFSNMPALPGSPLRIEFGIRALVSGTFSSPLPGRMHEAYAVIDEYDAVPLQTYGTRFFTGFATNDLEIGQHLMRLAIPLHGETFWSSSTAFEVVPICLGRFAPFPSSELTPASIDWADRELTHLRVSATSRAFARGEIACVRGWAIDEQRRDSARSVFVRFECGAQFEMQTRAERRDVAEHLSMPGAAFCGFVGGIATATLPAGRNVGRCSIVSKKHGSVYETAAEIELVVLDP